jgi:hypothetical protein
MSDDARDIGRLEGKVERLIVEVSELRKDLKEHSPPCRFAREQEERIKALEESRAVNKGWIAGAMFVSSMVGGLIAKVWHG